MSVVSQSIQPSIIAVDITQPLAVSPQDIDKLLMVKVGDVIDQQTILARKKGLLGLQAISITSPINGTIVTIDREQGRVLVQSGPMGFSKQVETHNNVPLISEEPTKIQLAQAVKQTRVEKQVKGFAGFGEGSGEGYFIKEPLHAKNIDLSLHDKIILSYNIPDTKTFYKASAIGVAAIVVASNEDQNIIQLSQDLGQKISIGFLALPKTVQVHTLHKTSLQIDGRNQILTVLN